MSRSSIISRILLVMLPSQPVLRAAVIRQKVAIVADVGIDDAGALLWALADESLEILGVGAAFGTHPDVRVTAANARRVLRSAGRADVPVFLGAPFPLGTSEPLPAGGTDFHGRDGLGDLEDGAEAPGAADLTCAASGASCGRSTAEFLVQAVRASPQEVSILVFSPLTDVAIATMLEPELQYLAKSLVVMGGAVFVPGNVSPLAEANFARDALAAKLVVQAFSAQSLVLAPLDVTLQALVAPKDIDEIRASGGEAARLWARAAKVYSGAYCSFGWCDNFPLHDAVPVAYLTDPGMFQNQMRLPLKVIVSSFGEPEHGATIADRRFPISVTPDVNRSLPHGWSYVRVLTDLAADDFVATFVRHCKKLPLPS